MPKKSKTSGVEIPLAQVHDYMQKHQSALLSTGGNIRNPEEIEDDIMILGYSLIRFQPVSKSSTSFLTININKDLDFSMNLLSVALRYCFDQFTFNLQGGVLPEEFKVQRIVLLSEGIKDLDEDE